MNTAISAAPPAQQRMQSAKRASVKPAERDLYHRKQNRTLWSAKGAITDGISVRTANRQRDIPTAGSIPLSRNKQRFCNEPGAGSPTARSWQKRWRNIEKRRNSMKMTFGLFKRLRRKKDQKRREEALKNARRFKSRRIAREIAKSHMRREGYRGNLKFCAVWREWV